MPGESSNRPTREELDKLLAKIRPRMARLFLRHGVPLEEAACLAAEAWRSYLYRWDRVRNPEWWLLDWLEKAIRRTANPSPKEPRDD